MMPPAREERARYDRLLSFFTSAPPPPDPLDLYPRYPALRARLRAVAAGGDEEATEEALLALYCHVHGHEAPYTAAERRRVAQTGGYWCHAGGLPPLLKAGPFLDGGSVSMDLGAGNGLQSLLLMRLSPHRRTIQVEISSRMVEAGRALVAWAGVPEDRVEWRIGDVLDASVEGVDFLYLYRPVRPVGPGRAFYERLAATLASSPRPVTVFSVADALRDFLPPDSFEIRYTDGHLTCLTCGGG